MQGELGRGSYDMACKLIYIKTNGIQMKYKLLHLHVQSNIINYYLLTSVLDVLLRHQY